MQMERLERWIETREMDREKEMDMERRRCRWRGLRYGDGGNVWTMEIRDGEGNSLGGLYHGQRLSLSLSLSLSL